MKIHQVLLAEHLGQDTMETLCNRIVAPVRDKEDNHIKYFVTTAGNHMQCVFFRNDVTCTTCQQVAKNIKCH